MNTIRRLHRIFTAIRVLPRTILHNGWRDFCHTWDTEIELALLPKGKRL